MKIVPLRNMLLVQPRAPRATGKIHVIGKESTVVACTVLSCGPEVRDITPGTIVLANRLSATAISDSLLIPESAILGTL